MASRVTPDSGQDLIMRSRELSPRRAGAAGRGIQLGSPQDLPHRGRTEPVAQPDQFAVHPAISPPGRSPAPVAGQVHEPRLRSRAGPRGDVAGPSAADQPAMPAQDRLRPYQQNREGCKFAVSLVSAPLDRQWPHRGPPRPGRRILIPWNQATEATCHQLISHSPRLASKDKAISGAAV